MNWLLWREYRASRLILTMGLALVLSPYFFMLVLSRDTSMSGVVLPAAVFSYGFSPLIMAFLGGNAFAGECADRSAEFVAYLPVSQSRRLLSKLILAGIVTALIWGINFALFRLATGYFPWQIASEHELLMETKYSAVTGLLMFGVGWCVSSFQSSPTFAICGAIIAPFLILAGLAIAATTFTISMDHLRGNDLILSLILGIGGFAFGTWRFLTRLEP